VQGKYKLNLLQAELLPKKALLSLKKVLFFWLSALVVMVLWSIYTSYSHQLLTNKDRVLANENKAYTKVVNQLEQKLRNRKVDSALTEKLSTVKLLMLNKKALHRELTDPSRTFVSGFATAMTELANLHHKDISLQAVNINTESMTFTGLARVPNAVPAWLAGFENSTLLSGKSFLHFKLSENKNKVTEFVVSSKVNGASN